MVKKTGKKRDYSWKKMLQKSWMCQASCMLAVSLQTHWQLHRRWAHRHSSWRLPGADEEKMNSFIRKHFELRAVPTAQVFFSHLSSRGVLLACGRPSLSLQLKASACFFCTTSTEVAPKRSLVSELILHQQKLHTVGSVLSSPEPDGWANNKGIFLPWCLIALLRKGHCRSAAGSHGQSFLGSTGTNLSWWQTLLKCSWHLGLNT